MDASRDDPNRKQLILLLIAMIAIPLGLIVLFLAFTRGERSPQTSLTSQTSVGPSAVPASAINGRWLIGGKDSWVGYSVTEELLSVPAPNTAEGKTGAVEGGMFIANNKVTAVAINADLKDLKSDDPERDNTLKTRGLETDRYPVASFALTEPMALPANPRVGEPVEFNTKGDLTIHGTTKAVEFELKAQFVGGDPLSIEVVGDIPIMMRDFNIEPPNVANMIKVQDHGFVRVHLRLVRLSDEVATNTVPPGDKRRSGTIVPATTK